MADTAPIFPKLLSLPAVIRPAHVPVAAIADVKSAADLPDRLFLGKLAPESFTPQKKGWKAEWRDADGHVARFRCAGHLSSLELVYDGDELVTLITAERFAELGQTIQNLHPGAWMDKLAKRLEPLCNLRVFPHREEDAVGGDFPDGHLLSLVMPVAADRLMALFELHKQLQADAAITSGIDAYLRLAYSIVNYLEGQNPGMLAHPVGLVMHHVNALGTPAADMPVREEDSEGRIAWTLRRSHYLYVAHLHLRDAARFVARLVEAGFIGRKTGNAEGYPNGAEFGAALLPFGYEYAAKNVWWFDAEGRRRMFYPSFAEAEERNALASHSGEVFLKSLIRDAQKVADRFKAETAQEFMAGMAATEGPRPGQTH
jgi:hypothetical protein